MKAATIKLPTYSICNLLGADRCAAEFVVVRLRDFVETHRDLKFPHRHDFYQIVLFTRGGGRHSIDFRQYEVQPHQVYYMAPGQVHTWSFDETTDGYLVNFNASFFTSIGYRDQFLEDFPLFNGLYGTPVNTLEATCCPAVEQTFAEMLEEYEHGGEFKKEMLRGLLLTVLVRLSRAVPEVPTDKSSGRNLALMQQFQKLIEVHFREKRLPREYAGLMFITPNHLNALTNSVVGKSAGELIRDRILLEAKRLLINSDLLVGQVAEILHFEDSAYFTRFFKKYLGTTPEAFRAAYAHHAGG